MVARWSFYNGKPSTSAQAAQPFVRPLPPSLPSHPIRPSVSETWMGRCRSVGTRVGYSSLRDGWMDRCSVARSVGWVRLMWRFCGTRCIAAAAERDRRCRRRRQRNAIASERMREGGRQGQVAEFNAGTAPREGGANACGVRECSARGVTDDSIKVSGCNDKRRRSWKAASTELPEY